MSIVGQWREDSSGEIGVGEGIGKGADGAIEEGDGGGDGMGSRVIFFLNENLFDILSESIFFSFLGLLRVLIVVLLLLSSADSSVLLYELMLLSEIMCL